jgi:hypothetical protein
MSDACPYYFRATVTFSGPMGFGQDTGNQRVLDDVTWVTRMVTSVFAIFAIRMERKAWLKIKTC